MPDVADPQIYLVGVAAILDEYPPAVRNVLADPRTGTRLLKRYPDLHDIRDACDRAYEPIEREIQRKRAADSHALALAAPAKPGQERRDEQFIDYETRIKPLLTAGVKAIDPAPVERVYDGQHWKRIGPEIETRRARNQQRQEEAAPPPTE